MTNRDTRRRPTPQGSGGTSRTANGFDLLERLYDAPLVIFSTAYDEYAVRAYDVHAFDYLLKPIRQERLAVALDKARAANTRPPSDRVFVRDRDRCWIVALADIALFEADGNYTRAFFGGEHPMVRTSLQALEARLDPAVFFRVSRRHIINLRYVDTIDESVDDAYSVRLRGGHVVPVSRRQSRRLRETLSLQPGRTSVSDLHPRSPRDDDEVAKVARHFGSHGVYWLSKCDPALGPPGSDLAWT